MPSADVVELEPMLVSIPAAARLLGISRNKLEPLLDSAGSRGGRQHRVERLDHNRLPDFQIRTVKIGSRRLVRLDDLKHFVDRLSGDALGQERGN